MKRAFLLIVSLFLVVLMPGVAQAHSQLVSTSPEDGSVLSQAPTEVVFEFNEPLLPDFLNFIAVDASGQTTELVVTAVQDATATLAWPAAFPGGDWKVEYRIVSEDGHPVSGAISFSYPATSPSPTSAAPTSASPAPTSASPAPTSASPETPSAVPSPTASPASDSTGGSNTAWIIAGVGVGILVIIAVVGVIARRRAD